MQEQEQGPAAPRSPLKAQPARAPLARVGSPWAQPRATLASLGMVCILGCPLSDKLSCCREADERSSQQPPHGPCTPHRTPALCLSRQSRVQAVLGTTPRCLPHPGVQGHHGLLLASLAGQDTQSQHKKLSLEEGRVVDAGLRVPAASACPWVGGVLDRKAALCPLGKDNPGPRL